MSCPVAVWMDTSFRPGTLPPAAFFRVWRRRYRAMAAARTTGRGRFVTLLRVPRAALAASTRGGGGS
jgi:hypothetical protein